MRRYALPAIIGAVVMMALPALAQTAPKAPPSSPGARKAPAATGSDVVGSVFGKQVTWDDLLHHMSTFNPAQLQQAVAQVSGPIVASGLFGASPKSSVVVTRSQVLTELRDNPPLQVVQGLGSLLMQMAVEQDAAQQGVSVTQAQVSGRVDNLLKQLRQRGTIPANMTDDQFLSEHNISRAQLEANFAPQMLMLALAGKDLAKQYGHPVGPSDFVQARHILINSPKLPPNPTPAQKKQDQDALAKIQQIRADIVSGKSTFEAAAKQYSDDPGSKENGGDLGVFMRGSMVPEFDATVFTLKPGEISQPVRSQYGYHLIQVEKLGKDIPADQRETALENHEQQVAGRLMQELQMRAHIENYLRPTPPMMAPGGQPGPPGVRPGAPGPPPVGPGAHSSPASTPSGKK